MYHQWGKEFVVLPLLASICQENAEGPSRKKHEGLFFINLTVLAKIPPFSFSYSILF